MLPLLHSVTIWVRVYVLSCVYVVLFVLLLEHPDNSRRDILFILFDDKKSVMKDWEFGGKEWVFRVRGWEQFWVYRVFLHIIS